MALGCLVRVHVSRSQIDTQLQPTVQFAVDFGSCRESFIITVDNDTLLVEIAGREHIFSLFIATSYCQLVVLYGGSAENFVLPIRTGT